MRYYTKVHRVLDDCQVVRHLTRVDCDSEELRRTVLGQLVDYCAQSADPCACRFAADDIGSSGTTAEENVMLTESMR